MSETTTGSETFAPTTRPIRRFVTALAGVALLLASLGWSGLVAPRLSSTSASGSWNQDDHTGTVSIPLTNKGPIRVWIKGIEADNPITDITDVRIGDERLTHQNGSVDAGETVQVHADFRFDCADLELPYRAVELRVLVRTALGIQRQVGVDVIGSNDSLCNAGARPPGIPPGMPPPLPPPPQPVSPSAGA